MKLCPNRYRCLTFARYDRCSVSVHRHLECLQYSLILISMNVWDTLINYHWIVEESRTLKQPLPRTLIKAEELVWADNDRNDWLNCCDTSLSGTVCRVREETVIEVTNDWASIECWKYPIFSRKRTRMLCFIEQKWNLQTINNWCRMHTIITDMYIL